MRRFYLAPEDWLDGQPGALTGAEAHHCRRVIRVASGDEIEVIDGIGRSACVRVEGFTGDRVELAPLGPVQTAVKPRPGIHLACAIAKGRNIELVIQKATELGVDRITPVITERTIARPVGHRQSQDKCQKWRRIALESTKQCGRRWLPEIMNPMPWDEFVAVSAGSSALHFIASLERGSLSFRDHLDAIGSGQVENTQEIVFAVGPEGDFTPQEYDAARSADFFAVNLGEFVLRAETAAIAGLAVLVSELRRFCPQR